MNFDVFIGVKFVLASVSCLLHKQSSGDKTYWKTQYHMYLLKYHPCFVWAGSEQFCPVPRERPDRDQGIEGSTAAQGKELEASTAEKGSQPVVATRTRRGSCGGGSRGPWCLERVFGSSLRGDADSGFLFSLWVTSQGLSWALQTVGTATIFYVEMKIHAPTSLVH